VTRVEIADEQPASLLRVGPVELLKSGRRRGEAVEVCRLGRENAPANVRVRVVVIVLGGALGRRECRDETVDVDNGLGVAAPARFGDREAAGELVDQLAAAWEEAVDDIPRIHEKLCPLSHDPSRGAQAPPTALCRLPLLLGGC